MKKTPAGSKSLLSSMEYEVATSAAFIKDFGPWPELYKAFLIARAGKKTNHILMHFEIEPLEFLFEVAQQSQSDADEKSLTIKLYGKEMVDVANKIFSNVAPPKKYEYPFKGELTRNYEPTQKEVQSFMEKKNIDKVAKGMSPINNLDADDPIPVPEFEEGGIVYSLPFNPFKNKFTLDDLAIAYDVPVEELMPALQEGIRIEREHTDSIKVAERIALDHLAEDKDYYSKLKRIEDSDNVHKQFAEGGVIDETDADFYSMDTPTGKKSKLTYLQQVLVRTTQFKKWFGDWEKAARRFRYGNFVDFNGCFENVSKVIDMDTLEPKLVYHGTSNVEFSEFDTTQDKILARPYGYFAENREYAMNFTGGSKPTIYDAFLVILKPFDARGSSYFQKNKTRDEWIRDIATTICFDEYEEVIEDRVLIIKNSLKEQLTGLNPEERFGDKFPFWAFMSVDADKIFKRTLLFYGYDGVAYGEEFSLQNYNPKNPAEYTLAYTIFNSIQIKLGNGMNLDFDPFNTDIRFEHGGQVHSINKEQQLRKDVLNSSRGYKNIEFDNSSLETVTDFIYELENALAPKDSLGLPRKSAQAGYIIDGKTLYRIKNHFSNPSNFEEDIESEKYDLIVDIVCPEKNNRSQYSAEDFTDFFVGKNIKAKQIVVKNGMTVEEVLQSVSRGTTVPHAKQGMVITDDGPTFDAKKGGMFHGKLHSEGGIDAVVAETGQPIEVETDEVIINRKSVNSPVKKEYEGELLTNKEILSRINEEHGGVSFEKGGEIKSNIVNNYLMNDHE